MQNNQQTNLPTNIQTGYLFDTDGKKFDISVIVNFPNESDYENDFPETNLIDFYFGTPNDSDTTHYVKRFVENQNRFKKLLTKLYDLKAKLPDDSEINEQIEFVRSQIKQLH